LDPKPVSPFWDRGLDLTRTYCGILTAAGAVEDLDKQTTSAKAADDAGIYGEDRAVLSSFLAQIGVAIVSQRSQLTFT